MTDAVPSSDLVGRVLAVWLLGLLLVLIGAILLTAALLAGFLATGSLSEPLLTALAVILTAAGLGFCAWVVVALIDEVVRL